MAIPQVEEEQRRKRPATIVPPPNGAAAAPARQPFAGRDAAVTRLDNKGPTIGQAARGAYTGVPRVIAGAVLEPPARVGDAIRGGIASVTGRELVSPNALEQRATGIKSGGADDIGAFVNTVGAATKRVLGAVPVGETRPAAPRPVAASPAPRVATPPVQQKVPTVGQAASAARPTTVEVPRGTLASLRPAESTGGMVRNLSGPSYLENAGGLLAMADERARQTEANYAKQAAGIDAAVANARNQGQRDALQSELNRTKGPSFHERGTRAGVRINEQRGALQAAIADLSQPVSEARTPTVGDLNAQAAVAEDKKAEARLADVQAVTEQQNAETEARKQAVLSEVFGSLTPEQKVVALTGNDPRAARPTFQIATNEEADPLNPGATLKTSYLIDGSGNVRPVAASAASSIPQAAIDKLKSDPKLAKDFDAKYGAGASARYLG